MYMDKTSMVRGDPETTVSVIEHRSDCEGLQLAGQPKRFGLPVVEASNSSSQTEEQVAGVIFRDSVGCINSKWQRVEFRRSWLPSPDPIPGDGPNSGFRVFIHLGNRSPATQAATVTIAVNTGFLDRANVRRIEVFLAAGPYRAFTVFKEGANALSVELGITPKFAVFPRRGATLSANPQCSVARNQ